jgi:hypothetical protein
MPRHRRRRCPTSLVRDPAGDSYGAAVPSSGGPSAGTARRRVQRCRRRRCTRPRRPWCSRRRPPPRRHRRRWRRRRRRETVIVERRSHADAVERCDHLSTTLTSLEPPSPRFLTAASRPSTPPAPRPPGRRGQQRTRRCAAAPSTPPRPRVPAPGAGEPTTDIGGGSTRTRRRSATASRRSADGSVDVGHGRGTRARAPRQCHRALLTERHLDVEAGRRPTVTASRRPKMKSEMTKPSHPHSSRRIVGEQRLVLAAPLAVDRVVGAHHRRDAGVGDAPEVRQVHLVQRSLVDGDVDGEAGVLHRVEREVLHARHHVALQPAVNAAAIAPDVVRVLAVGLLRPAPRRMAEQVHAHRAGVGGAAGPELGADRLADAFLEIGSNSRAAGHADRERRRVPITQPRGPSAKSMPGMPSRVTCAAGHGMSVVAAGVMSNRPGQNGVSPSRQPSFSSSVICSTSSPASRDDPLGRPGPGERRFGERRDMVDDATPIGPERAHRTAPVRMRPCPARSSTRSPSRPASGSSRSRAARAHCCGTPTATSSSTRWRASGTARSATAAPRSPTPSRARWHDRGVLVLRPVHQRAGRRARRADRRPHADPRCPGVLRRIGLRGGRLGDEARPPRPRAGRATPSARLIISRVAATTAPTTAARARRASRQQAGLRRAARRRGAGRPSDDIEALSC